jgi:hypothetical protein
MTSWADVEKDAPVFAAAVRARFEAGVHKTLATLRRDGSPRISGTEVTFADDGELTLGMSGSSVKLADVRRDPRVALHCPTLDAVPGSESEWPGDAKLAGLLVEIPEPAENPVPGACFFRFDLTEVVFTRVGDPADHLVVEAWHPGRGLQRRQVT